MSGNLKIETEIRRLIENEDSYALELIYDYLGKRLYGYILTLICSEHDAEELVQDLFLKIVDKRKRLLKSENLAGYIFAMTRNLAMEHLRRRKRNNEIDNGRRKIMKKKKVLIWSALVSGSLITLYFVVYAIFNIVWGAELRQELSRLKESGEPMTTKEIAPVPLPSHENASIEYMQIFSLLTDGTFSSMKKDIGVDAKKLQELDKLCFSTKTQENVPEQCKKNLAQIQEILNDETFKQVFELCQKAASKPRMNFNLNYDEGPSLSLPHLKRLRDLARLLYVKAEMEILSGERDKAWETIMTGLKVIAHLKNEPFLISQLVYYSCDNIPFNFFSRNLPLYGINDAQAEKIIAELDPSKTEYRAAMKKALIAERICMGGWIFEHLINGRLSSKDMQEIFGTGARCFYKLFVKQDYLEYLKIMNRYENDYDQPFYKLTEENGKRDKNCLKSISWSCRFTRQLIPSFEKLSEKTAKVTAYSQEIRIRLALEIYKNRNGRYPDKLEELSPQILPEIPISELTGKPFSYTVKEDSYLLLSDTQEHGGQK